MKFLLGVKQNMSQVFGEDGAVHPVTVLATGPLTVTALKTVENDGYKAIQVGFGTRKAKNVKKPQQGQFGKLGSFQYIREIRLAPEAEVAAVVGEPLDVSSFKTGDVVAVSAVSKGKGFQGVVKRHGFHGGPRSHGQKHSEREPGSISGGLRTVLRHGMRMAGRMGGDRTTVKNLKIAEINSSTILIQGAVPGRRGTLVEVRG
jgi:large subunit ribosomal protein L3